MVLVQEDHFLSEYVIYYLIQGLVGLLVVELDYLPNSKVFYFSSLFIPHEIFTPQKYVHSSTWGCAEGGTPSVGSGSKWAPRGGLGVKSLKEKLPCKGIL
jgi:hypothetical protein